MNFNHFPKKVFKVGIFLTSIFPFKCSSFLKNSFYFPKIFIPSWFSQIFINFLEISNPFIRVFLRNWFPSFSLETFSNSKAFSKHASCFPTCILQNYIAHAWILCAFRIEHNFDNSAKSSTLLVLGSITPVKGGRNGRTSYRQVKPHPMDFPTIFKNGGEYFKTNFQNSGQVWLACEHPKVFKDSVKMTFLPLAPSSEKTKAKFQSFFIFFGLNSILIYSNSIPDPNPVF